MPQCDFVFNNCDKCGSGNSIFLFNGSTVTRFRPDSFEYKSRSNSVYNNDDNNSDGIYIQFDNRLCKISLERFLLGRV